MSLIQEALRRQEEDSRDAAQPASKEVSAPASPTPPPVPEPPVAPGKTVPGRSAGAAKAPPSMAVDDRRGVEKKRFSWPVLALVLVLLVLFSSAGLLMFRVLPGMRRPESGTGPEPAAPAETSPLAAVPDQVSGQVPLAPEEFGAGNGDGPSQDTLPVEMGKAEGSPPEVAASDPEPGEVRRPGRTASEMSDASGSGGGTQNAAEALGRSVVEAPDISASRTGASIEGGGSDRQAQAGFVDEGTLRPEDDPDPVRPEEIRPEETSRDYSPKSPEALQKGGRGAVTTRSESRGGERRDSGAADPGATPAPPVQWPRLRITGVLQSNGRGAVIVNNQVISVGETIMGAKLVEVFRQGAEFLIEGETRRFHVGQGEGNL